MEDITKYIESKASRAMFKFDEMLEEHEAQITEEEVEDELLERRNHYVDTILQANIVNKKSHAYDLATEVFDLAEFLVYHEVSKKREDKFLTECKLIRKEGRSECTCL